MSTVLLVPPRDQLGSSTDYSWPLLNGILRHMYALLSATAGRMAIISPPHERSAVKFMHQAAHVMREFLLTANPIIDSQIILNIYHLGLSEYYREDLRVAKIHLRILNELCHNLDLRNTYDRYLYDGICSNDIFVAIETPSSPCMPLCWDPSERVPGEVKIALRQAERKRSWDPYKKTAAADKLYGLFTGPFVFFKQPKIDAYNMNANIPVMNEDRDSGSGLEELVQSTLPSNAMRPILVDLISHLGTAARCSSQDTIVNAWLGKKNVAIMHRLASLTCDEGISECCRLACLIMLSYVVSIFPKMHRYMFADVPVPTVHSHVLARKSQDSGPPQGGLTELDLDAERTKNRLDKAACHVALAGGHVRCSRRSALRIFPVWSPDHGRTPAASVIRRDTACREDFHTL